MESAEACDILADCAFDKIGHTRYFFKRHFFNELAEYIKGVE